MRHSVIVAPSAQMPRSLRLRFLRASVRPGKQLFSPFVQYAFLNLTVKGDIPLQAFQFHFKSKVSRNVFAYSQFIGRRFAFPWLWGYAGIQLANVVLSFPCFSAPVM